MKHEEVTETKGNTRGTGETHEANHRRQERKKGSAEPDKPLAENLQNKTGNSKLKRLRRRGLVEEHKQKGIGASLCWSEDLLLWYILSKHAFLIRKPLLLSLIRQEQIVLS